MDSCNVFRMSWSGTCSPCCLRFAKMRKKQQELEAAMEKEKAQRDRALAVPTNDHAVAESADSACSDDSG